MGFLLRVRCSNSDTEQSNIPSSNLFCPGGIWSTAYMLLLMDVAKLFCLDGMDLVDLSMLESPLLEPRRSSGSSWSGKAQGKPFVGAAAMGSGMPETLRGLGLMTGARRGA